MGDRLGTPGNSRHRKYLWQLRAEVGEQWGKQAGKFGDGF